MMIAEQQSDWLKKLLAQFKSEKKTNNTDVFFQIQDRAQQILLQCPTLSRQQEAWRYNRIDKLFKKNFKLLTDRSNFNALNIDGLLLPSFDSHHLLFINGHYIKQHSDISKLPNQSSKPIIDWLGNNNNNNNNNQLFSWLNTAFLNDGVVIHIGDNTELDKPIEIIYFNTSASDQFDNANNDGVMTQIKNRMSLGVGSKVTLIERFISNGYEQYFHNNFSDILLADKAVLKHYRIQDESPNAYHLSHLSISQQKNSIYDSTHIALGSLWSKTDINVDFKGQNAECDLNGLYLVGNQQLTDFHLDVKHSVPGCTSREYFKGILHGKGRAVFDGRILVDKQAQHSDAQLKNYNLMLTQDAEVDTKPQLEIYADNVKCSHGTTIGQIDPEQLFYMRSRGLSQQTAYKLLCLGFADEIINRIDDPILSEYVSEKVINTLNDSVVQ